MTILLVASLFGVSNTLICEVPEARDLELILFTFAVTLIGAVSFPVFSLPLRLADSYGLVVGILLSRTVDIRGLTSHCSGNLLI